MSNPNNPFELPELAEDELIYPESLLKSACTLAAHYIAARRLSNVESAERIDLDIGAFLSEEFGEDQADEQAQFRSRFMTMRDSCSEAFGHLIHHHSRWACDLGKGQRLKIFYAAMRKAGPPSSAKQSRDMMARILKQVEDQYAPPGSEKMTILELTHRMVVPYGSGGFFVPLIGGEIHINANGAAGLFDCYQSKYQLEIASASGAPFLAVLGFQYPFP